jgi:sugar O-acyltransferase (sialic acid O-acetyltransferase NeuD family)
MNDIAVYGAGGLGRETALMIEQINAFTPGRWNFIGFFDDGKKVNDTVDDYPVLGGIAELKTLKQKLSVVLAIADPSIRKNLAGSIRNPAIDFPVLVHPSVLAGSTKFNTIGQGSIIAAGNILTTQVSIGEFVIVNLSCTIGHDVHIGPYSTLMPGCSISGFVNIGDSVVLGTRSSVLPLISIESHATIGAGAVVTKNVASGTTVVGVPAAQVK